MKPITPRYCLLDGSDCGSNFCPAAPCEHEETRFYPPTPCEHGETWINTSTGTVQCANPECGEHLLSLDFLLEPVLRQGWVA